MEKYYFYKGGKKFGPFNEEQLKKLASERTIGPETLIISGSGEKRRAKLILGLFPEQLPPQPVVVDTHSFDGNQSASASVSGVTDPFPGMDVGTSDRGGNAPPQSFPNAAETSQRFFCPHCGASVQPGSILCDNCRQPLTYCTNCGHLVNRNAVACLSCGLPPKTGKEYCHNCGSRHNPEQIICLVCGCSLIAPSEETNVLQNSKNRIVAAVLAICLGGLGIQKFYMGSWGWGIIYAVVGLATWGIVTGIASLVEGIMLLCMSDKKFAEKYPSETEHPMRW